MNNEFDLMQAQLKRIAKECIENNWSRTDRSDSGWHYFSDNELSVVNERAGTSFRSGYCFLDEDGGTEGLIRLEGEEVNPKWTFRMDDEELIIELV